MSGVFFWCKLPTCVFLTLTKLDTRKMIHRTLRVPTDWNDITIRQYQEFSSLSEEATAEELQEQMLRIFCDVEPAEYRAMSNKDKELVVSKIVPLFTKQPQRVQRIDYNGKRYGFHPNLEELTFGEFVDLEAYESKVENLHKVAHILFRPITKSFGSRYRIEEYDGSHDACEAMRDFPVGAILAGHLFFWILGIHLSNAILKSSEKVEQQEKKSSSSSANGDGRQRYTTFAREMLRDLMKSPKFLCNERFFGLLSKATRQNLKES